MEKILLKYFNKVHSVLESKFTTGLSLHKTQTAFLVAMLTIFSIKTFISIISFELEDLLINFGISVLLFYNCMAFNHVLQESLEYIKREEENKCKTQKKD